jgi:hypothetical protein
MTTEEVVDKAVDTATWLAELRNAKTFYDVHTMAAKLVEATEELAELQSYFPAAGEHLLAAARDCRDNRNIHRMTELEAALDDWAAQLVGAAEAVAHGAE